MITIMLTNILVMSELHRALQWVLTLYMMLDNFFAARDEACVAVACIQAGCDVVTIQYCTAYLAAEQSEFVVGVRTVPRCTVGL